jgi:hypothetical protein
MNGLIGSSSTCLVSEIGKVRTSINIDGKLVNQEFTGHKDLFALAPWGAIRLPQLDGLVQIVDEKAQFSRLEVRKAKPEGLLWLAVAEDHDSMSDRWVQSVYFYALLDWPRYQLLRIDFHREFCRVAKQIGSTEGHRFLRHRGNAKGT